MSSLNWVLVELCQCSAWVVSEYSWTVYWLSCVNVRLELCQSTVELCAELCQCTAWVVSKYSWTVYGLSCVSVRLELCWCTARVVSVSSCQSLLVELCQCTPWVVSRYSLSCVNVQFDLCQCTAWAVSLRDSDSEQLNGIWSERLAACSDCFSLMSYAEKLQIILKLPIPDYWHEKAFWGRFGPCPLAVVSKVTSFLCGALKWACIYSWWGYRYNGAECVCVDSLRLWISLLG